MISENQALQLLEDELGDSARRAHSARVGDLMAAFAQRCSADEGLWRVAGLCHDLDYEKTTHDRSKHGVVTSERLKDKPPEEALEAIAAHDHRTGVRSDTLIAVALRAADSFDAIRGRLPFEALRRVLSCPDPLSGLRREMPSRAYLVDNLKAFLDRAGLKVDELSLLDKGPKNCPATR